MIDTIDPEELQEVIAETLDGLADTMRAASPAVPEPVPCSFIRGEVPITGASPATFVLQLSVATGVNLTSQWIGIPADELTADDACETVAELSNLLAGSAKTLIDDETELSMPTATIMLEDEAESIRPTTTVDHHLGSFSVEITS